MVTRAWKPKAAWAAVILSVGSLTYMPESHARYVPGAEDMCEVATVKRDKRVDLEIEKVTTAHEIMTAERTGMMDCTQIMNDTISSAISKIGSGGGIVGMIQMAGSSFNLTGPMCDSVNDKVSKAHEKILSKVSPALGSIQKIGDYVSIGQEVYSDITPSPPPLGNGIQPSTGANATAPAIPAIPSASTQPIAPAANLATPPKAPSSLDQLRKIFNSGE